MVDTLSGTTLLFLSGLQPWVLLPASAQMLKDLTVDYIEVFCFGLLSIERVTTTREGLCEVRGLFGEPVEEFMTGTKLWIIN